MRQGLITEHLPKALITYKAFNIVIIKLTLEYRN